MVGPSHLGEVLMGVYSHSYDGGGLEVGRGHGRGHWYILYSTKSDGGELSSLACSCSAAAASEMELCAYTAPYVCGPRGSLVVYK